MTLKRKEPLLHMENIEKYYGNPGAVTKALDQVSFDVQAGEFISIMGASGSGKTTLLNCISTIDTVSSGHILLDGQDITTITEKNIAAFRRDYLGFVFQDFNLLDTLTLEENIALPLTISETPPMLIEQQDGLECAGYAFADSGVFSESFSQVNDYGNGAGYVIVVPDGAIRQIEIVYSVYAAVSKKSLSPNDLQNITSACDGLVQLDRSSAKSTPSGAPTIFMHEDMDYLSGKWMDKTEFHYLYSMLICLFYLALILEITGAAILATQVLSDWQVKQRQDRILRQLGMNERLVSKLNNRQLSQISCSVSLIFRWTVPAAAWTGAA